MAMELDAAGHGITGDIASDTRATLVAEANGAAPGKTPATITVELDAGNTTVHLPAGTDTSHPVQVGNDLEFIQPDGSIILIPGGAVAGLVIFVGDIEIPADAVAALFSANNIQPAEGPQGPPEGAHGNFTHEPGSIGNAFGLTDLLGPNELAFGTNPLPELFGAVNAPPRFVDGSGADISTFAMDNVTEEALTLPPGNPDNLGNPDTSFLRQTNGTFFVTDPNHDPLTFTIDPPAGSLSSGGDPILWSHSGSNVLIGALGDGTEILRVTLLDGTVGDGQGSYSVTLSGPIDHPFHGTSAADEDVVTLQFPVTVSDGQGGSDTATFTVGIEDDSPELEVSLGEGGTRGLTLNLDETVQPDGGSNAAYDRYNSGESESAPGTSNGGVDDVGGPATYNRTPVLSTNPSAASAIGHLATASGAFAGLFDESPSYGADGQGAAPIYAFGLSLSVDGLATNLTATGATILPGLTTLQRAISLYAVSDTVIEGRIAGNDPSHQYVAFRITIENPGDPATAHLVVDQFLPIDHGGSESPSVLDEVISLLTPSGSLSLNETVTITDGDGDTKTDTSSATLIGSQGSVISFDDDGPRVSVSASEGFSLVHDETLLVQSGDDDIVFTSMFNGVANPGVDNDVPFNPGLHLPIGYARSQGTALAIDAIDYGTDGAALTGAKVYSLTLTDANGAVVNSLGSGLTTTEGKQITLFIENGMIVGRYDGADAGTDVTGPTDPAAFAIAINSSTGVVSLVQYVSLHHGSPDLGQDSDEAVSLSLPSGALNATLSLTDGDGDVASASAAIGGSIQFEDDGPLILTAKVDRHFGLLVDETQGTQAGTDDVTGPLAVFSGVANVGLDPDRGAPLAYAVDHHQAISFVPFFGVDGQAATGAVAFSLVLGSDHDSGLSVTDGSPIVLSVETDGTNHWIVGRVDGGTFDGKAAFALAIDPSSGEVSLVQYLSLEHVAGDPNDPIALASGAVQAVVTITDGDGDTASKGVDISGSVVFRDDGPTMLDRAALAAEVDEDGLHRPSTSSLSDSNPDTGKTGEVTGTNSAVVTDADVVGTLKSLVDFGADGFGSFELKAQATGIDSGVDSKGDEVLIVTNGNTLYGYVGASTGYNAGTDRLVFQLTLGADGSFAFQLFDQIDHPSLDGVAPPAVPGEADNAENLLTPNGIDLSGFVLATDGDGDSIPLGTGAFTVQVRDDIPVLTARNATVTETTHTVTTTYTLQAGHTDVRGMDGQDDRDIRLTGDNLSNDDDSVNTSSSSIGVGKAQDIDGFDSKHTSGPEILTLDFIESFTVGAPPPPLTTYDVAAVRFTIDVAQAQQVHTAVLFIGASDGGVFEPFTLKVDGIATVGTPVYQGATQIGVVFSAVPDGATIEVIGNTPFDQLKIGNYSDYAFDSDGNSATDTTISGGNSFKVSGIESDINVTTSVTETFSVIEDESLGVTGSDPFPSNDVDPAGAPGVLAGAFGYARSATQVTADGSLFAGSVGADEKDHPYSFAITDAHGQAFDGADSGLKTLSNETIWLTTDGNGVLVGAATGQDPAFKVYVDADGYVWIAQYAPIRNDIAGDSAAAYDDAVHITPDLLHITATLTDFDGDSVTQISPIALDIQFQDDGPKANDDTAPTSLGGAPVIVDVAANDQAGTDGVDWSNASGTAVSNTDPAHGSVVYNGNGTFTYTPTAGYEGDDSFTYTITDGDGDTSTATVQLSTDAIVGTPTVQANFGESANPLVIKEDNSATVTFTADVAAGSDDVLTQLVITGLQNGVSYAINGGAAFTADGNPITIALPAHPTSASIGITAYPPEDSDADLGTVTVTATAADGNNLGTTTTGSASAAIVVDAVLDDAVSLAATPQTTSESTTAVALSLGLDGTAFNPFTGSGNGGPDTDGSESGTFTLTLSSALPSGVTLGFAGSYLGPAHLNLVTGTTFTITGFSSPADLAAAIDALVANVPAGFDGSISGSVQVSFTEANTPAGTVSASGAEPDEADNSSSASQDFSLTVTASVATPTISSDLVGQSLLIKEDGSAIVTLTATAGTTDVITSVTVTGLTSGATYVINGTTVAGSAGSYTVDFPGTHVSESVIISVSPAEDSDVDLTTLSAVATAKDADHAASGDPGLDSAPITVPVVVDAVLDQYGDPGQSVGGSASEAITSQNVALNLTLGLVNTHYASPSNEPNDGTPADSDGSETIAVTITVGSAANTAGVDLTLASPPAGASLIETVAGSGIWTLTVTGPADLAAAVAGVQAVVPANFDGTVSGTIEAVSTDNSTDSEPDPSDNSETHSANWSLSIAAQAAAPTVTSDAQGGQLLIKEDGSGTVTFSLNVASGTDDVLTQAVVSGLHNGITYTISGYNSGNPFVSNGSDVTVSFAAHTTNTTVAVTATPPADSDMDLGTVTVTATAADGDDATATNTSSASAAIVVDAILDDAVSLAATPQTTSESTTAVALSLGLDGTGFSPFTGSGNGGPDTDGSESGTLTLTLGSALPSGVTLGIAGTYAGPATLNLVDATHFTITGFTSAADLAAAIDALVANVPAGFDGTISGSVQVSFTEANTPAGAVFSSGAEPDVTDNTSTASQDFSLTVTASVATPTINSDLVGQSLLVKEDGSAVVTLTATAGATDVITSVTVTGLTSGATYVINGTTVLGSAGSYTVDFPGTHVSESVIISVSPPEDSDVDLTTLSAVATAKDADHTTVGDPGQDSTPVTVPVVVDAILDQYVDASAAPVSGSSTAAAQTLSLGVGASVATAPFTGSGNGGADTDGSESTTAAIVLSAALPAGGSLSLASGSAITLQAGVDAQHFTLTGTAAQVQLALTLLQVTVPAAYSGTISGTVTTTSSEAVAPGSGSEPITTDNSYTDATPANFSVVIANSTPQVIDDISGLTVREAALDTTPDVNDLAQGVTTGTDPSSPDETKTDTNTISFNAVGENITSIKFADPNSTTDAFADPAFAHLGAGQGTPTWTLSGDGRTLTLSYAGQTALILHLTGATTINAGVTDTVSVTATLVDHFFHELPPSAFDVILSGIKVVATDQSGDQVAGSVTVNIVDDAPIAADDATSVTEDTVSVANGNVFGTSGAGLNDHADNPGADGAAANVIVGVRMGDEAGSGTAGTVGNGLAGLYGTLTLNANGTYTYTLDNTNSTVNALNNGGTLVDNFTYTIADSDGDTDKATLAVTIHGTTDNTVPTGGGSVSLTVSEAALDQTLDAGPPADLIIGNVTGTDPSSRGETDQKSSGITFTASATEALDVAFANPADSTVWAAPTVSGLAAGYTLTWSINGSNELVGNLKSPTNVDLGPFVYLALTNTHATVSTSVTPTITATLVDNLIHTTGSGPVTITGLQVVATDTSGDHAAGSVSLTVNDDAPTAFTPDYGIVPNTATSTVTSRLDITGNIDTHYGADGAGSIKFNSSLDNASSGLTSHGLPITYHLSNNGLTLTGSTSTGTVFTVVLQPDGSLGSAADTYQITMDGTVDGGTSTSTFAPGAGNFTGGNDPWVGFFDTVTNQSHDVLITPIGGTSVNTTANASGVGGGASIDSGETMRIDYVKDLTGNTSVANGYSFAGHELTNGAAVSIGGISSSHTSTVNFAARLDQTANTVGNGTLTDVNAVTIFFGNASQTISSNTASVTIGGATFGVQFVTVSGHTVARVSGIVTGTSVAVFGSSDYSALEVGYQAGDSFQITGYGATTITPGTPVNLNLGLVLTDADGDSVSGNLGVTLSPAGVTTQDHHLDSVGASHSYSSNPAGENVIGSDFNDTITGDATINVLSGGAGADTVTGGAGADVLIGGAGIDHFVISNGDTALSISGVTTSGAISGYDVVADFDPTVDKLDLDGTPFAVGDTGGIVNGSNSSLTIGGTTTAFQVGRHSITGGVISFFTDTGATALTIATTSDLAAVVQYLHANDLGNAGATVAFYGLGNTYIYEQVGIAPSATNDILVQLSGLTSASLPSLSALISGGHVDPIVLDLDHNGYTFSTVQNGVSFDINADGHADKVAWNTSGDGMLAIDLNHDGKIDDGKELFTPDFNGGHFASGSAALASLDTNHDGVIDSHDIDFSNLVVWKDANADGITDSGELTTLSQNGIASITAPATPVDDIAGGQTVTAEGTVTYADGSTGGYVEVALDAQLGSDTPLLAGDSTTGGIDWDNVVVGTPDAVDTLHGTAGADKFVLTDASAVDFIADYNFDQGDTVDLSALLGHNSGATTDNAGDYVRLEGNTLQVDVDGAGSAHEFIDVSVLNQPVADVRVILDDGVDATINHIG